MIEKMTWEEFRKQGFLWWINMILHTFGLAIVVDVNKEDDSITNVYPARVKFRGFNEENNTEGYKKISAFMVENAVVLEQEAKEE